MVQGVFQIVLNQQEKAEWSALFPFLLYECKMNSRNKTGPKSRDLFSESE